MNFIEQQVGRENMKVMRQLILLFHVKIRWDEFINLLHKISAIYVMQIIQFEEVNNIKGIYYTCKS